METANRWIRYGAAIPERLRKVKKPKNVRLAITYYTDIYLDLVVAWDYYQKGFSDWAAVSAGIFTLFMLIQLWGSYRFATDHDVPIFRTFVIMLPWNNSASAPKDVIAALATEQLQAISEEGLLQAPLQLTLQVCVVIFQWDQRRSSMGSPDCVLQYASISMSIISMIYASVRTFDVPYAFLGLKPSARKLRLLVPYIGMRLFQLVSRILILALLLLGGDGNVVLKCALVLCVMIAVRIWFFKSVLPSWEGGRNEGKFSWLVNTRAHQEWVRHVPPLTVILGSLFNDAFLGDAHFHDHLSPRSEGEHTPSSGNSSTAKVAPQVPRGGGGEKREEIRAASHSEKTEEEREEERRRKEKSDAEKERFRVLRIPLLLDDVEVSREVVRVAVGTLLIAAENFICLILVALAIVERLDFDQGLIGRMAMGVGGCMVLHGATFWRVYYTPLSRVPTAGAARRHVTVAFFFYGLLAVAIMWCAATVIGIGDPPPVKCPVAGCGFASQCVLMAGTYECRCEEGSSIKMPGSTLKEDVCHDMCVIDNGGCGHHHCWGKDGGGVSCSDIFCSPGELYGETKISSDSSDLLQDLLSDRDYFGASSTWLGDVDGDGVDDMAVGATQDDDGGNNNSGAVYTLLRRYNGSIKMAQKISSTQGGLIGPLQHSDNFGRAVASIGDLDGDGVDDIVVGASGDSDGGTKGTGAVFVLFLGRDGSVKAEQKISATRGGLVGPLKDAGRFGVALAAIGDLDGDGIGEIAVGAMGGNWIGAVYVLFLNIDGMVRAEQENTVSDDTEYFGCAVAGLGDLNDDGVPDIAVGAYGDDDGGQDRGAVYVLLLEQGGSAKQVQKISTTKGGFVGPLQNYNYFGRSLAALGDLDGDGVADLAVGVPRMPANDVSRAGGAYVLLLREDGTVKSDAKLGIEGLGSGDELGISMSAVRDLNGESGMVGLALGTFEDRHDGGNARGAVYTIKVPPGFVGMCHEEDVLGGGVCANTPDLGYTCTDPCPMAGCGVAGECVRLTATTYECRCEEGRSGKKTGASLSDICHDPCPEAGCGPASECIPLTGSTYECRCEEGRSTKKPGATLSDTCHDPCPTEGCGFAGQCVLLSDTAYECRCEEGRSTKKPGATLSDICYDVCEDDNGGCGYHHCWNWNGGASCTDMFCSPGVLSGQTNISSSSVDLLQGMLAGRDSFGVSVTWLGDVDGDGVDDVAVGASLDDDGEMKNSGAVYIFLLRNDGSIKRAQKISSTQGGLVGPLKPGDKFGSAVAVIGDLDEDGVDDIVVGSSDNDGDSGGKSTGGLFILFLRRDGSVKAEQKISATQGGLVGPLEDSGKFGAALAAIGDLDGDGVGEIAVGASGVSSGSPMGSVHVLFLRTDGVVRAEQKNTAADTTTAYFGSSIAGLGDLNDDGVPDIAVGAYGDDGGGTDRGAVYVLLLAKSGIATQVQKIGSSKGGFVGPLEDQNFFGRSLAALGDLDGDGVVDLAVGASGMSDGVSRVGGAYLLLLRPDGTVKSEAKISSTPSKGGGGVIDGLSAGDELGVSMSAVRNLNGDSGITGLAVGSPYVGEPDRGAVYILKVPPGFVGMCHEEDTGDRDTCVNTPDFGYNCMDPCPEAGCGAAGQCVPLTGTTYECRCEEGRSVKKPGATLTDICHDPCPEAGCGFAGQCIPLTDTTYECRCEEGRSVKKSNALTSSDICYDPCPVTGCGVAGLCVPLTDTAYECRCEEGRSVKKINAVLTDICHDPCPEAGCGFAGHCVALTDTAYECRCEEGRSVKKPGATLISDICQDICKVDNGGCGQHHCWYWDGGISCADMFCSPGYVPSQTTIDLQLQFDSFGESIAWLGDVDADGVDDVAVGASLADGNGDTTDSGAVNILLLRADGSIKVRRKINQKKGGLVGPLVSGDNFGSALAAIGDLDGDGVGDIVVGASGRDGYNGGTDTGAVFVLFLNQGGSVKAEQTIGYSSGGIVGPLARLGRFGTAVASIGDLDGDGVREIAVGATPVYSGTVVGSVYVLFLHSNGMVRAEQKLTGPGTAAAAAAHFGCAVAGLGDLNGDGVPDIAVGAYAETNGGLADSGAVYILLLTQSGAATQNHKISASEGGLVGPLHRKNFFGQSLAALGDLDGDGVVDLVVGAPGGLYQASGEWRGGDILTLSGGAYVLLLREDGTVKSESKIRSKIAKGGGGGQIIDGMGEDETIRSMSAVHDLNGERGVVGLAVGVIGGIEGTVHILRVPPGFAGMCHEAGIGDVCVNTPDLSYTCE